MARGDIGRDTAPSHDIHQPLLEDSVLQDADVLATQQGLTKLAWAVELGALLQLAAPVIIQLGSQYAVTLTNQLFVGSLGPEPLAAAAIGTTWFNLSFYFLLGISTALDTLGSQAHGKGNFGAVLACCISAAGVMGLLCLPISVALWWSDTVARVAFRQKPAIASLVKVFCAWLIPGLIPFVFAIIIMKGLQVQNMVWPPAIISTITAAVNVPVNAVLINWYGFHGAAAATSVTRIFQLIMLVAYILILYMFSQPTPPMLDGKGTAAVLVNGSLSSKAILKAGLPGHQQEEQEVADEVLEDDFPEPPQYTVTGILQGGLSGRAVPRLLTLPSKVVLACMQAVWNFLLLGLPGGVMMALDAASFDITTVMAGFLGEIQVDAHTVLLTTCVFIYMSFPFGLATASTIRVGNLLGSYQPGLAKLSGYVATVTGTAFMGLACLLLATLRWRIGPAYVDDAEVAAQVAAVAPISAVYQIPDGIYCLASGVLRGLGKQGALAWINLISFWAVGVPTGLTLTFPLHWRLSGIWWGIVTGVSVAAVCCLVALLRIDWETEAADAHAAATADMASAESSAGTSPTSPAQMPALTGDLESAMATPESSSGRATPIRRVPSRGSRDVPIGHPVLGSYASSCRSSGSLVDRKLTGVFGSLQGVDPISRSFAPHH